MFSSSLFLFFPLQEKETNEHANHHLEGSIHHVFFSLFSSLSIPIYPSHPHSIRLSQSLSPFCMEEKTDHDEFELRKRSKRSRMGVERDWKRHENNSKAYPECFSRPFSKPWEESLASWRRDRECWQRMAGRNDCVGVDSSLVGRKTGKIVVYFALRFCCESTRNCSRGGESTFTLTDIIWKMFSNVHIYNTLANYLVKSRDREIFQWKY